jgi:5'(3')-deoxyribonucleotidase
MHNRRLFLDCDQVLADFDGRAESLFGMPPRQAREVMGDDAFWDTIRSQGDFFLSLQVLSDGKQLYDAVKHLNPIILTGTPPEIPEAAEQKRAWAAKRFPGMPIITCASADKRNYMKPGDVLVDDWPKYRRLWEEAGGVFILHVRAEESIQQVLALFAA